MKVNYEVISEDDFLKYVTSNKLFFYKGIKEEYLSQPFARLKTSDFIRTSKEREKNYHFYDLIVNNCLSWKQFPKRKHAIIGTTSFGAAIGYTSNFSNAGVYVVIPLDGCNIAICPEYDFLYSFKSKFSESYRTGDDPLPIQLNFEIADLLRDLKLTEEEIKHVEYEDLIFHLTDLDSGLGKNSPFLQKIRFDNNPAQTFSEIFDPIQNGFSITTSVDAVQYGKGKEVFVSGEVLLCRYDKFLEMQGL